MPRGRPSKYKPEYCLVAGNLCKKHGFTNPQLAEIFGVNVSTLNLWIVEHPEFSDALKIPKAIADAKVEKSLYHKAIGYSHEAVKILIVKGQVVKVPYIEHYPPDTASIIYWLNNRQKEHWRNTFSPPPAPPTDDAGALAKKLQEALKQMEAATDGSANVEVDKA